MNPNKNDATCGDPTCTHDWCKKIRAEQAAKAAEHEAKHQEAVNAVEGALRQVLSVNPQVLHEAAARLGAQAQLDAIKISLQPKQLDDHERVTAYGKTQTRFLLCLAISRTLLGHGLAQPSNKDMQGLAAYLMLANRS
jgi:hypothetical protein